MFQVPNGATIDIATAYGTAAAITALSNAAPAVATAANTLAAGDIVEVVSGWNMLNNGAFKVASPSGTAFSLAGVDTANATVYPAGNGIGTFRKVTAWQRMSEVTGFTASGGEQEYAEVQYLESLKKTKFPTIKGSMSAEFMVSDAMDAASLAALTAADLDQTQRAVKVTLPNGKVLMFSATVSMSKMPSMKENENMTRKIKMELTSDVVKV